MFDRQFAVRLPWPLGQKRRRSQPFEDKNIGASIEARVTYVTSNSSVLRHAETAASRYIQTFQRKDIALGGLIGQGNFADVFQVRGFVLDDQRQEDEDCRRKKHDYQLNNDRCLTESPRFVLKQVRRHLLPSTTSDPTEYIQATRDLILEAKYLSMFDHPHIVKLRGAAAGSFQRHGGHDPFFLILDQVDETLSDRIKFWKEEHMKHHTKPSGSLAKNLHKLRYAWQMASALQYLHEQKIVYRDVKGDNVGILRTKQSDDDSGDVQLLDFGLCRELPKKSPSSTTSSDEEQEPFFQMTMVGTRRYCAPELLLGQGYNTKADVYSWAVLVHEMISLKQPYSMYDKDAHEHLVCRQGVRPELKAKWPCELKDLLRDTWEASVEKRIPMTEVCHRLKEMLDSASSAASTQYVIDSSAIEEEMNGNNVLPSSSFETDDTTSTLVSSCASLDLSMDKDLIFSSSQW
jgi:serine/threonine protein kinase